MSAEEMSEAAAWRERLALRQILDLEPSRFRSPQEYVATVEEIAFKALTSTDATPPPAPTYAELVAALRLVVGLLDHGSLEIAYSDRTATTCDMRNIRALLARVES